MASYLLQFRVIKVHDLIYHMFCVEIVGKFHFNFVMQVLDRIIKGVEGFGFQSKGWIESPLKGAEGNTEFLVCFVRKPGEVP